MQLLRLTVRHSCPYSGPVAGSPTARVTHLCHRGAEAMLELHDPDAEGLARIVAEYERIGGVVVLGSEERTAVLCRFPECACCRDARVIPTAEAVGLLYLPPSSYGPGGEEVYQFLSRGPTVPARLLSALPSSVQVVSTGVRSLTDLDFENGFLVPVGALFQALTPRQRAALVLAIQRGYYRTPRPVKSVELARELGISREAFEALLRKSENKLATALFPYLVLGGTPPRET